MKYIVIYGKDGKILAAAPVGGDLPIASDGEQSAEVDVEEDRPDFGNLYLDAESSSLRRRSDAG